MAEGWFPRTATFPRQPVPHEQDKAVSSDSDSEFESIQDAVDATSAGGRVAVGPGLYEEQVTISTDDLDLVGAGNATLIDGTDLGDTTIIVTGSDVSIRSVQIKGDPNATGVTSVEFRDSGSNGRIHDVQMHSDNSGAIDHNQTDGLIENVVIKGSDGNGVIAGASGIHISDVICEAIGSTDYAVRLNSVDVVLSGLQKRGAGSGVRCPSNDCVISGVRVDSPTNEGVRVGGSGVAVSDVVVSSAGSNGVQVDGNDVVMATVVSKNASTDGFRLDGNDTRVYGLHATGSGGQDLDIGGSGLDARGVFATNIADTGSFNLINGMGEESAAQEEPSSDWITGSVVDFTDSGDGSGTGLYVLKRDGNWAQIA